MLMRPEYGKNENKASSVGPRMRPTIMKTGTRSRTVTE